MSKLARGKDILREEGLSTLLVKGTSNILRFPIREAVAQYIARTHEYKLPPHLPTLITVSPGDIKYNTTFSRRQFPTSDADVEKYDAISKTPITGVLGGPWDRFKRKWEEQLLHQSFRDRFEDGLPWEETEKYRSAKAYIENGSKAWSSTTLEELHNQLQYIDDLHDSISEHGLLSQDELHKDGYEFNPSSQFSICGRDFPRECRVGIGSNGDIIRLGDGRHRVSLAKILNVESVPLVVVVRHQQWQSIRNQYQDAESVDELTDELLQFREHPDIRSVSGI